MNTNKENNSPSFEIKVYTTKELRQLYQVPYRTFERWIKPYKQAWGIEKKRQYLTIKQVRLIVEQFGIPGEIDLNKH
jgi:hypothetical protein